MDFLHLRISIRVPGMLLTVSLRDVGLQAEAMEPRPQKPERSSSTGDELFGNGPFVHSIKWISVSSILNLAK